MEHLTGGAPRLGYPRTMCRRAHPADVEGYGRGDRHGFLEVQQGVGDVEEVPDMKVRRLHARLTVVQVERHTLVVLAGPERDRPEQAAWVGMDPWVEVVNLGGEVFEVEPTPVEVQSNEPKSSVVSLAVLSYVDTLHKAYVGVEQERLDAAVGMLGDALSPHVRDADETLEVGDQRRIHPRPERGGMESLPAGLECYGRRLRRTIGARCRRPSGRPEQASAHRDPGSGRRATDEAAPRETVPSVMCR